MKFTKRQKISTNINMTPLIDIVFLLLIFFMLISNFIKEESLNVELPQASKFAQAIEDKKIVTITVDKLGHYYINSKTIAKEMLQEQLKDQIRSSKIKEVYIHGDKSTNLQNIIFLMDTAKKSGATSVSIKTQSHE